MRPMNRDMGQKRERAMNAASFRGTAFLWVASKNQSEKLKLLDH